MHRTGTLAFAARRMLAISFATALAGAQAPLTLPAFTGYAHPDPDAVRRRDDGSVARCDGHLVFYVHFATAGELHVALERLPSPASSLRTTLLAQTTEATSTTPLTEGGPNTTTPLPAATSSDTAQLGTFTVTAPGYHRIVLAHTDDSPLRNLRALRLTGPAAVGAHANTAERRNASSVHLGYPVPKQHQDDVQWFYCEVTPRTDPLWTYYMATGWHRGYFGMQVNSPTERRLIFSVWDAGNEGVDRGKVAAEDRVQLVAKGEGVHAGDFGNEGTGGHSHLVHDWRLGSTFRFLLHAAPDGDHTTYSGWFWFADRAQWGLIASFRAPKDGKRLRGLYSFNENFSGSNGDLRRDCEFGNVWVRTTGGTWLPLRAAHFTHDDTGAQVRLDRCGGVRGERFYLQNGGFVPPAPGAATAYRARLEVPPGEGRPPEDATLPAPPRRGEKPR